MNDDSLKELKSMIKQMLLYWGVERRRNWWEAQKITYWGNSWRQLQYREVKDQKGHRTLNKHEQKLYKPWYILVKV